jgi:pyrroloquinoline quinone biosynthesis protein B
MKLRVLGSAAGGGFPQWNCNCANCDGVRRGTIAARPRTQSSIAVTEDEQDWVLINASPDLLAQIKATPALQPARAVRDSGIAAVLLMDAQIDHVTGLLMLRERGTPLPLYATAQVMADLKNGLNIASALAHYCKLDWRQIAPGDSSFPIAPLTHTRFSALTLDSKAPPYSPHRNDPHPGDNIGLSITNSGNGRSAFYAPGLGALSPAVLEAMKAADVLLVDGTFWRADEMIQLGLSAKTAADMGHLPQQGPGGMIETLDTMPAARKILIHINNSNPILREDSAERALLAEHGIEVAHDGMEIDL